MPPELFADVSEKPVAAWRARAAKEYPSDLPAAAGPVRYTLLSMLCHVRETEITDSLVELFTQLAQKINTCAEKKVEGEFNKELKRVRGKEGILLRLAEAAVVEPGGTVRKVIYPVAGESMLKAPAAEAAANEALYRAGPRFAVGYAAVAWFPTRSSARSVIAVAGRVVGVGCSAVIGVMVGVRVVPGQDLSRAGVDIHLASFAIAVGHHDFPHLTSVLVIEVAGDHSAAGDSGKGGFLRPVFAHGGAGAGRGCGLVIRRGRRCRRGGARFLLAASTAPAVAAPGDQQRGCRGSGHADCHTHPLGTPPPQRSCMVDMSHTS
ncbi:hypothetical protein OJ963_35575 [Streptomyces sp. RS2]|nr:hypothetical protein [Streptomyces sp. RS2]MCW1099147.1 hypothetical protein [Streptomyces sp. RS2]